MADGKDFFCEYRARREFFSFIKKSSERSAILQDGRLDAGAQKRILPERKEGADRCYMKKVDHWDGLETRQVRFYGQRDVGPSTDAERSPAIIWEFT